MEYTIKKSIMDLLGSESYIIPIYQRNFAWEYNEVWQLLYDIHENVNPEYHIGTLVVSERVEHGKTVYEVIDGQQRLTALNIIYSVLAKGRKMKYALNLKFESREKSNTALRVLRANGYLEDSFDESWKIRRALTPCTELRLTLENFIKMTHKTSWLTGQIKNGLYFLSLHVFRILSPESSIW